MDVYCINGIVEHYYIVVPFCCNGSVHCM